MRKGEFDLTGKAIDCRELPSLGDAGKEIFRALGLAVNLDNDSYQFCQIEEFPFLIIAPDGEVAGCIGCDGNMIIKPHDVLGQDAIDAAMGGATIVFSGDEIPDSSRIEYYPEGEFKEIRGVGKRYKIDESMDIIAYKILEEAPSIESRVLSEKMEFKELCPACRTDEWQEREAETYDDLRDAHLELIQDSMAKDIEIESLKSRIKELERARNDAKAALDV